MYTYTYIYIYIYIYIYTHTHTHLIIKYCTMIHFLIYLYFIIISFGNLGRGPKPNSEHIIKIKKLYEERVLNFCCQINKNQKNILVVNEESPLVLGERNITVKVCTNLKRLLLITFNIKAIRI